MSENCKSNGCSVQIPTKIAVADANKYAEKFNIPAELIPDLIKAMESGCLLARVMISQAADEINSRGLEAVMRCYITDGYKWGNVVNNADGWHCPSTGLFISLKEHFAPIAVPDEDPEYYNPNVEIE